MALDSKHPMWAEFSEDWEVMEDTYRGERVVKDKGQTYLPATAGMHADGMAPNQPGWLSYRSYKGRAVFHDFVADAVEALLGMMHHKPAKIELPPQLEPMLEKATINGESLQVLLRRINEAQLVTGRIGLLLDLPATPTLEVITPYIATYHARNILNWDRGRRDMPVVENLSFVCLDESEDERKMGLDFDWERVEKYRVLLLGDGAGNPVPPGMDGVYQAGVFRETKDYNPSAMMTPSIRGNTLEKIPFIFINSKDVVPEPDDPPLLGLAKLTLAIYRTEADYRQTLFMQGQDTLVVIGGSKEDTYRVGANAKLDLPLNGDAKYIGVGSEGLKELREALQNDKSDARSKGSQMVDSRSREAESGEALTIRVAARTASLNQIARTGAFGLQQLLRMAAEWMGADPEAVVVEPNLDFASDEFQSKTLLEMVSAKTMGAPLSRKTIHDYLRAKDITSLEYEDELALIEEEEPMGGTVAPIDMNERGAPGEEEDEDGGR